MSQQSRDERRDQNALIDALAQTAFVVTAVLGRVGLEHDLSLTQLRMLGVLRDRRLRMSGLASFLGLEKSTLSGLVDRALARGLVERSADPDDRRAVVVTLSARGAELAAGVFAEVSEQLLPLLASLEPADQRRLSALLAGLLASP
ncbi:MarR family transcriptional regulator [Subtercola boreus]|uniref:MarR family transcriptional regulator n=1 Tax=Subtercola boreus TaxID=120213 RepID=A0A3E0VGL0_9MICO|nr:MarR family transcriptional regulator [Subtercola boreus]RFA08775.1 MarR family transcriptional regulator [Subtercola boreus]TQL54262.1 DNA-binding MarR family transcriptional regulator [Subtercola boreus]